jgi:GT2 family glycosyltransferase
MKTAFICVNYNNSKVTIEYILNILNIKQSFDVKVIIVDNASNEKDVNDLDKFIHDYKNNDLVLIKSKRNLGYFKGLNLGLNYLNKVEFDYVVIGNNDLIFEHNFINELRLKNIDNNVFVISPNIIRTDGVHQNPHIANKFNFFQRLYRKLYFSNYYIGNIMYLFYNSIRSFLVKEDRLHNDKEQIILMGYGACYILTKYFFANFNELDAPLFLMGEEGVLANQVTGANGITLYCPNLIVNHHDHTSIGKLPSKRLYDLNRIAYLHFITECKYVQ